MKPIRERVNSILYLRDCRILSKCQSGVKRVVRYLMRLLASLFLVTYKGLCRPWLQGSCRFFPSCSSYAYQVFCQHSLVYALYLTFKRVVKCHPWGDCGYDPVPHLPLSILCKNKLKTS